MLDVHCLNEFLAVLVWSFNRSDSTFISKSAARRENQRLSESATLDLNTGEWFPPRLLVTEVPFFL